MATKATGARGAQGKKAPKKKAPTKKAPKNKAPAKATRTNEARKKAMPRNKAPGKTAPAKAAARGASTSTRAVGDKLQLKAPLSVRVVGGPAERLGVLARGVSITEGTGDAVVLFVEDAAALAARLDDALQALTGRALLWICYPKGGSGVRTDLSRDTLRARLAPQGLQAVAQVAVDEVWSALRFKRA